VRRGFFLQDRRAVSDVIGTVLLLGITVSLFAVLSVAVLSELHQNPPPHNVEFRVDKVDQRTTITSVWGEALPIADVRLIYQLNGVRTITDLSDPALLPNLVQGGVGSTASWDLGESLRMACPAASTDCAYPGRDVRNISVVQRGSNFVLFSSEPGVLRGSVVNPVADLSVRITGIDDPAQAPGAPIHATGSFVVKALVANEGVLSTPPAASFTVRFYIDGVQFFTFVRTGPLGHGESFTVDLSSAPPSPTMNRPAGTYAIRATVDSSVAFSEASMANNQYTRTLQVVP
jgi:flagellin-like protein